LGEGLTKNLPVLGFGRTAMARSAALQSDD
jgi:hypothetical protein